MTELSGLTPETQVAIERLLDQAEIELKPVPGGFTNIEKFLVTYADGTKDFVKFADASQQPVDATILDHEAKIYTIPQRLGLAQFFQSTKAIAAPATNDY